MKQLLVIAIKGTHTEIVFGPAIPSACGKKKSELMKSGNWKGWQFQIRYPEAYKVVKILTKKLKAA